MLCCSWASEIRAKVIAIRKTYNDLRVGSNPSGCLLGGKKRGSSVYFGLHANIPVRDHVADYCVIARHNDVWISDKNSFSTQRYRTPIITYNTSFLLKSIVRNRVKYNVYLLEPFVWSLSDAPNDGWNSFALGFKVCWLWAWSVMLKCKNTTTTKSSVTKAKQGTDTQFRSNSIESNGSGFYYIPALVFHNLNGHRRMKKRRGPKIKPCGTSLSTLAKLESTPETEKICLRSDK